MHENERNWAERGGGFFCVDYLATEILCYSEDVVSWLSNFVLEGVEGK